MAKKPSEMTPSEYRAAMVARRKKKKDARTNASEFANLGSAKGMQKETNKARNEGRSARLGTGNPMKSRGADPANLAGKGGRGTGLNLAKKTKQVDIKSAAAKRRASDIMSAAEKKAKQSSADKIAAKDANMNIKKSSPAAAKKTTPKTWKDVTSISAAKAAGLNYYSKGGKKMAAVTKADLDKSGLSLRDYLNYKTGKTRKAAPKKTTATAKKAASKKPTTKSKDPRGNQIKATPGKKGPLASARKEYPVTGPGSQSKILRPKKAAAKIPAGAKPFTGKYDSKKFKLQNINGKTFVVPRGK